MRILLVILIVIGLVLRFWQLSLIPLALYHDELDHVFLGESIARFGTDVTGEWSPVQLQPHITRNVTAELPAVFHAAAQTVFGFGADSAHLPNALFGLATVTLVGVLAFLMTKRKEVGVVVAVVMLLNPWHIHLSRMTYEATISLFFQVLFVTALVAVIRFQKLKKPWQKITLLSVLPLSFFGAYFTYHGAKLTMLALGLVAVISAVLSISNRTWKLLVIGILVATMGVHAFYTLSLYRAGTLGGREGELIIDSQYLEDIVNEQRRLGVALPLPQVFTNKATIAGQEFIKHYGAVFDLNRLFLTGYESGFQFSLLVGGFFYLSALVLIPLGIFWGWQQYRKCTLVLAGLLVVSPITNAITISYQALFRSALTYTLLLVFAGLGLMALIEWLRQRKLTVAVPLVLLFLAGEAVWFGYHYLSRYPILTADNHYFGQKLVATYANRVTDQPLFVVVEDDPYTLARAYLTYGHNDRMASLSETERTQFNQPFGEYFTIGKTTFTTDCVDLPTNLSAAWAVDPSKFETCGYEAFLATSSALLREQPVWQLQKALGSPIDSRAYYLLLNDPLCPNENLNAYTYVTDINKYDTPSLTNQEFCATWIKLDGTITPPATTP